MSPPADLRSSNVIDFERRDRELREYVDREISDLNKVYDVRFGYMEKSIDAIIGYGKTLVLGVLGTIGLAILNLVLKH